jgi:tetratricopeptide (TPR) repeat protein
MWRSLFWIFLLSCGGGNPLERAQADLAVGNWADAEANFRKALDDHPDSVEALYGLGWVYHLNGSSSRARDYFMRCLRVNAEDYRGYKGLGSLALGEGNFVVAVQRFNDALQRKPNDPAVLNSMSLVHLGSGQFEKARELLMPLVLQYPTRGELSLNLAESHFRLKDYPAALKTIDGALGQRLDESRFRPLLHTLRALVLVRLTAGRLDLQDCAATRLPLMETLALADKELDQAEALDPGLSNLSATRLRVHRRRSRILQDCPLLITDGSEL